MAYSGDGGELIERNRALLENRVLPGFFAPEPPARPPRWFPGHGREIRSVRILDHTRLPESELHASLLLTEVHFASAERLVNHLPVVRIPAEPPKNVTDEPLSSTPGHKGRADFFRSTRPESILAELTDPDRGLLVDGMADEGMCEALLAWIARGDPPARGAAGTFRASKTPAWDDSRIAPCNPLDSAVEQSNSSAWFGDRSYLKLFRTVAPGVNPELELSRYLAEQSSFTQIAAPLGWIDYQPTKGGEPWTLAIVQSHVPARGDAWEITVEGLGRMATGGPCPFQARLLGLRIGALHDALSGLIAATEHQAPILDLDAIAQIELETSELAKHAGSRLEEVGSVGRILDQSEGRAALERIAAREYTTVTPPSESGRDSAPTAFGTPIRVHGDLHLGQVLVTNDDFIVIDFEGEPARSLTDRRSVASSLRDIAGMLRSFEYAAEEAARRSGPQLDTNIREFLRSAADQLALEFLAGYGEAVSNRSWLARGWAFDRLLIAELRRKLVHELSYELAYRPEWVGIPLAGLARHAPGGT